MSDDLITASDFASEFKLADADVQRCAAGVRRMGPARTSRETLYWRGELFRAAIRAGLKPKLLAVPGGKPITP